MTSSTSNRYARRVRLAPACGASETKHYQRNTSWLGTTCPESNIRRRAGALSTHTPPHGQILVCEATGEAQGRGRPCHRSAWRGGWHISWTPIYTDGIGTAWFNMYFRPTQINDDASWKLKKRRLFTWQRNLASHRHNNNHHQWLYSPCKDLGHLTPEVS
jgi:hypothetical protein